MDWLITFFSVTYWIAYLLSLTLERVSLKNYNWKISCYLYSHYEIVLLMIWVQYWSLNVRSSLHGISGKDFWRLELAHKSCILSPSGNRTVNIFYFVKSIYLQNSFSFTINTPSNKRPSKNWKVIKRLGPLFGVLRMKCARL